MTIMNKPQCIGAPAYARAAETEKKVVLGSRCVKIATTIFHAKFSTAPGRYFIRNTGPPPKYFGRTCQKSDWPNHKKVCGKALTPAVVQNATSSTEPPSIEVFFLTQMGPARDGYTRSQALLRQMQFLEAVPFCSYVFFSPTGPRRIKSPVFITYLVVRLAVQTAMATGDERCIAAIMGAVPEFQDAPSGFVDQLIEEYGETRVSVAVQARIEMDDTPILGQWIIEFLDTNAGSQYAEIASEPPEGPSREETRKILTDLREWWPRRF
jgi:hypothetical protein